MLAHPYRLRRLLPRPGLFQKTMQQGRRVFQCPLFKVISVTYHSSDSASSSDASVKPPVFGFIVSKKVALRANKRNRIKRRLRNLVLQKLIQPWRQHQTEQWSGMSGKAYVIIVHPVCAEASFDMMAQAVDGLCQRLP